MSRTVRIAVLAAALGGVMVRAAGTTGHEQTPTFSARVDAVRVDVLVTEGGRPVRGLQPSDFEITDNGVPQQVELASFEQIPLNVIVVLDMSDSVKGPRLGHLQAAGHALIDALAPADQAALVTFSHAVALRQRLTLEREWIGRVLDAVEGSGNTALVDATFAGLVLGESDVGRALLIVFSDGLDTASFLSPDAVLQSARRADVVAYGVSASGSKTDPFLEDLTELTGGAAYRIESTRDLGAVFLKVLDEFRQRYLLSYSPQGVSREGWHRLEVRVKGRRPAIKARPGYLAGPAPPG